MINVRWDFNIDKAINAILDVMNSEFYSPFKNERKVFSNLKYYLGDFIKLNADFEDKEIRGLNESKIFEEFITSIFEVRPEEEKINFVYKLLEELKKREVDGYNRETLHVMMHLNIMDSLRNEVENLLISDPTICEDSKLYNIALKMLSDEKAIEVMELMGKIDEEIISDIPRRYKQKLVALAKSDSLPEIDKAKLLNIVANYMNFDSFVEILQDFEDPANIYTALENNFFDEKIEYIKNAEYSNLYDIVFKSLYLSRRLLIGESLEPKDPKMRMIFWVNTILNIRSDSDREAFGDPQFCEKLNDDYQRILISLVPYYLDKMPKEEISKTVYNHLLYYDEIKEKIDLATTDEERKNIILAQDKYLKQIFIGRIENPEYRAEVIKSIDRTISPELIDYVVLAEKMIVNFFEKTCGESFLNEKMEKLSLVLARTNVIFDDLQLGVNGQYNGITNTIKMLQRKRNNPTAILGFLLHEYGHALSRKNFLIGHNNNIFDVEEGFADVFADIVMNHYLKDNNIQINGKKLEIEIPVTYNSSYYVQNGKIRTLLYALEQEGEEIYPIIQEYFLGDKFIVFEKFFTSQKYQSLKRDFCGEPYDFDISFGDIYNAHREALKNIDNDNYWMQNNYLAAQIQLENILRQNGSKDSFTSLASTAYFNDKFARCSYFLGKELTEIKGEDVEKFLALVSKVNCLGNKVIDEDYTDFLEWVSRVDQKTLQENSLHFLNLMTGVIDMHNAGLSSSSEKVIVECINTEIEKKSEEKTIERELQLYEFYNKMQQKLLKKKEDACRNQALQYISIGKKDVLDTLEIAIAQGATEEVLEYISKSKSEYLMDTTLEQLLEKDRVNINEKLDSASDKLLANILRSAITQGISLEECIKVIEENPEIIRTFSKETEKRR